MALNITGDMDQNLYRFCGATPEANLMGIEKIFPDILTTKLTVNYRSTKSIINATQLLINHNYADHGGPYEERFRKDLQPRPDAEDGEPVTFAMYPTPETEAEAVIETVLEALTHYKPGDIFIGARTRAQLGFLEGPLVRAKIPFINIAGGSFWASKHVADVVAYLKLAYDTSDNDSFSRIFNVASNWMVCPWGENKGDYCSHRYLGRAFLDRVNHSYNNLYYASSEWRFKAGSEDLTDLIYQIQGVLAGAKNAGEVIRMIMDDCYIKYMRHEDGITSTDEAENGKLQDLETVFEIATEMDIPVFIAYVDDCIKAAEAAKEKNLDDYLVLSTIHRLKGQERAVVYGVGFCEGEDVKTGDPRGLLPHTFSMTPPPQFGILPTGGMGRIEDETCVAFVLISRAKEICRLFGTASYRTAKMEPSRFVGWAGIEYE